MRQASTLGELRAQGYRSRTVKEELRENLLGVLRSGGAAFPGIVGFDDTVLPQLESALLAGHDLVLLGERGQGKTRVMRTLSTLLDEWMPVVAGCEINDDPAAPVCTRCRRLAAELRRRAAGRRGCTATSGTSRSWPPRTPASATWSATSTRSRSREGRTLGDPETVHYGLIPRTNRGIFGINELPDLAERIQVAMFNVLEERDIQVRGYSLRLPLDLLLVASANPEDYTNRGRIITPLKDRFGAEIRTHYPVEVDRGGRRSSPRRPSSWPTCPSTCWRCWPGSRARCATSSSVDQRAGCQRPVRDRRRGGGGRLGAAPRRPAPARSRRSPGSATSPTVLPTLLGKLEFEMGEEGREVEVRRTTCCGCRSPRRSASGSAASTCPASPSSSPRARRSRPASWSRPRSCCGQLDTVPGLSKVLDRLGHGDDAAVGHVAAAVELVLEGMHLTRRIDKQRLDGRTVYGT